jgi:hypothetical protein
MNPPNERIIRTTDRTAFRHFEFANPKKCFDLSGPQTGNKRTVARRKGVPPHTLPRPVTTLQR